MAAYALDASRVLQAARPLAGPPLVVQAEPSTAELGSVMSIESEENPCR
jgi:hypothetical protein